MDSSDNSSLSTMHDVEEVKYLGELIPVLKDLSKGTLKFSRLLNTTSLSLYDLLGNITQAKLVCNTSDFNLKDYLSASENVVTESEYLDSVAKWEGLMELLNKISVGFEEFSSKLLNSLLKELESYKKQIDKEVLLPTHFGSKRMTPDEFMQILRNYPSPNSMDGLNELKLRRNIIYCHCEFNSAKQFVSELQHMHADDRVSNLLKKSVKRVDMTRKLLCNSIRQLISVDNSYENFFKEYLIALSNPNAPTTTTSSSDASSVGDTMSSCSEASSNHTKMLQLQLKLANSRDDERKKFRHCTVVLESIFNEFSKTLNKITG